MSNLKLNGILLIFLFIGIVFIFFPIYSSVHLLSAIASGSDKIAFDKGAYYLFGGGLLFIVGPIWVLLLLAFGKKQTEPVKKMGGAETQRVQRVVYTFLGVCLASSLILPHIMSIGVGNYLEKRGYTYCDNLSRQWLFNRTMVYTKSKCDNEISQSH